jgi:hypothetical protein
MMKIYHVAYGKWPYDFNHNLRLSGNYMLSNGASSLCDTSNEALCHAILPVGTKGTAAYVLLLFHDIVLKKSAVNTSDQLVYS